MAYLLVMSIIIPNLAISQIREYRIHDRGMLHETEYNTGEIGRAWETGEAGNTTTTPLMEWPSRSATVVNGIEYSGQHNILGAGVYIAANLDGNPGKENRLYALCGGVGASTPEVTIGRWSFPIYMQEIDNYPVLDDGTLNPDYNPDEAEQIIIASWATPVGITVTRTSRVWSYPDYDDMIIYEYSFEYTGNTDADPSTIEQTTELKDAMICFIYGFAPSMYGYQRQYQVWKYDAGIYRGDQNGFWDADYWLAFNMNLRTEGNEGLFAKPEPNIDLFKQFSETGINGGGLTSPQAPGYAMLYYDTNHLAVVDPENPERNESEAVDILRTFEGNYYELDENNHIKQPWSNKISTGNTNSIKMKDRAINPDARWSGVYSENSTTWPELHDYRWVGRAAYPYRQSADAGQKHTVFGPYTLNIGDKLEFSLAEVVGYGANPGKRIEGGQVTTQWAATPSWDRKIVLNGQTVTEHYLTDYGYPDYINSDVVTVQQVTEKAFEAYLGHAPELPVWPEDNPAHGSYKIPVPPPAPAIVIENTALADVRILWNRNVEAFSHPRLTGKLAKYNIYRAKAGMGPWELLASYNVGDVNSDGAYEYLDTSADFKVGEKRFYAVTSVDEHGNESGKTNIYEHKKNIGAVETIDQIYVVPNPFVLNSNFQGSGDLSEQIGFYALPKECTIRIFSYAGQLVETIHHNDPVYSTEWFQVTRSGQSIASGVYFYVVTTPEGKTTSGKFVVVK